MQMSNYDEGLTVAPLAEDSEGSQRESSSGRRTSRVCAANEIRPEWLFRLMTLNLHNTRLIHRQHLRGKDGRRQGGLLTFSII